VKVLWLLGAVGAFILISYGMIGTLLTESLGGDSGLSAVAMTVGGLVVTILTFTFRRAFKDRWPN
jgi:hypothetical protein